MTNKRHTSGVADYKREFLDCRENHLWTWMTDWKLIRGRGGRLLEFERLKQCSNCGALSHRRYDGRTGKVISTRYSYPDGYLSTKEHKIEAGTARLEMLRRAGLIKSLVSVPDEEEAGVPDAG